MIKGGSDHEVSAWSIHRPIGLAFLRLVKAASDGTAEFTGKVFGADDFLAKAAAPDDAGITGTVTFTPADMAKLLKLRAELEKGGNGDSKDDGDGDEDAPDGADGSAGAAASDDGDGDESDDDGRG